MATTNTSPICMHDDLRGITDYAPPAAKTPEFSGEEACKYERR
jgi:hypothetical protein